MSVIIGGRPLGPPPVTPPPIQPTDGAAYTPYPATEVSRPSYGGFTISSSRGSVNFQGTFEALQGWFGLGPTKRTPNNFSPLGIDGVVRNRRRPVTRGPREMGGPVHVQAPTALERSAEMRHLLAVLSPLDDSPLTFSAFIEDGELITAECDAVFDGGDEFQAQAAYDTRAVLQVKFFFADYRFFGKARPKTIAATGDAEPFFPIGPIKLRRSTSFGKEVALDVGGDRPTHAVWEWFGPGSRLTVTGSGGEVWEVDLEAPGVTAAPLSAGERVVVVTDRRAVATGVPRVLGPGGEDYWRYVTKRQFFPLKPGADSVLAEVVGASSADGSRLRFLWRPAIEAIL